MLCTRGGGGGAALGGRLIPLMRRNRNSWCLGSKACGTIAPPFSPPVQSLGSMAMSAKCQLQFPLDGHLCWEEREGRARERLGNGLGTCKASEKPSGPSPQQRGRRKRVLASSQQAQPAVRKRVGPARGGGVWAAGTAEVACAPRPR